MSYYRNTALWLHALLSTVISSAAGVTGVIAIDPHTFNFNDGLPNVLKVAGVLAGVALMNYLQKHPLPAIDPDDERIERG